MVARIGVVNGPRYHVVMINGSAKKSHTSESQRHGGDRAPLKPGHATPIRHVPAHIPRPEYVNSGKEPQEGIGEPLVQTPENIERMREVSIIAANALQKAGQAVQPGVTTDELDRIVHDYFIEHDAYPSCLHYRGYPKASCISLNEIVCHGIPDTTVVQDGDIVNIDVTAFKNGVHGDTNATFLAGNVSEEHKKLVKVTEESMYRAIKACKPGRPVNMIGRVIESYARRFGYGVVRDFTGHGIGTTFHNGLVILHYDASWPDDIMEPGMTFTIEPMITQTENLDYRVWDDDWTVQLTQPGNWTAQFEHTLVVTEDGVEILTQPDFSIDEA